MERTPSGPVIVMGAILIALGILYFLLELIHISVGQLLHYGWPVLVAFPGLVLTVIGMSVREVDSLCIPGAIVSVAGTVLMIQNLWNIFGTWTYAWALVAPGGMGLGMWLQGVVYGSAGLRATGAHTMGVGLVFFLAGLVFFERVLHVSGRPTGPLWIFVLSVVLPLVIIVAGFVLLIRRPRPTIR
ncbi:MAG TPA: hypothetical protein VKI99_18335 [Candidatus Dormibacteraeota bacterium]|nr:hypothetical protein [Candidatus Dormibacteraeota bacterium]